MADVTKVAEIATEAVAPVVTSGELNWKRVGLIAGGTVVIVGCAVGGRYAYKKYKAKKAAEVNSEENIVKK